VLRLYGCEIDRDDADRLVAALRAEGSYASLEAAEAIRWGAAGKVDAVEVEPELREAILRALVGETPGLDALRAALAEAAHDGPRPPRHRRLAERLHNPWSRHCGCLGDCWCRNTRWGRVARWYVPARYHRSVNPCWKNVRSTQSES
jgi:hypothetical protein